MAGINRDGPAGTVAAMQQAARPPGGGGHDHPHEHHDLNEIVSDHAGHLDAHAGRLDDHDGQLAAIHAKLGPPDTEQWLTAGDT